MIFKSGFLFIQVLVFQLVLISGVYANSLLNVDDDKIQHDSVINAYISEENFILINGIEQWVTIKGEKTKLILLMLHGGPGSPISPFSDILYKSWEKDFIIVQWDQRGSGKTFGRNAPEELTPAYLQANPLSIDQMTRDGIALSEYLTNTLGKQKIILFGTSWGSVLGINMAERRPDLFYAYVGHSQVVKPAIDVHLYDKVYKLANQSKDSAALDILSEIGKPPYDKAKSIGKLLRIVKKYEGKNSVPAPEAWFQVSPNYDNPKDNQNRSDGDDYSFINFVGDKRFGLPSMNATISFMTTHLTFKIPIFIIQGAEDLLTPPETTRKYFDLITAPEKKYYLLPKTAHGFNQALLEAQYKICKGVNVF